MVSQNFNFHTIKSILNCVLILNDEYKYEDFHTIKSILNYI